MNKIITSVLKFYGGKHYLCSKILKIMENNGDLNGKVYVEACLGGGNLLINLPDNINEKFAFDINPAIIDLWLEVQQHGHYFRQKLKTIEYTEDNFNKYKDEQTPIGTFVRYRMSRGGIGKTFAWSERLRGGLPGDVNAYRKFVDNIMPIVIDRIQGVRFDVGDWIDLSERYDLIDRPDVVFYLDPPYLAGTRRSSKVYTYEMEDCDHRRLLDKLIHIQGRIYLSGYDNEMYNNALEGYKKCVFDVPNHSGQNTKKNRRLEVIWYK